VECRGGLVGGSGGGGGGTSANTEEAPEQGLPSAAEWCGAPRWRQREQRGGLRGAGRVNGGSTTKKEGYANPI
jgi:hypothetical protein